jgi:hypothetical protein
MPDLCPASFSSPVTINPAPLTEGAHNIRQTATDLAGNVATSATWNLYVDRTGPTLPANFDATYDSDTGLTLVTWNPSADPNLPGGAPGAGVGTYLYRYQLGSGAWTGWLSITAPWFGLSGSVVGQVINVQAQAVDEVGNVSVVASGTATNAESTLTADNVGISDPGETGDAPLDSEPADLPTDPVARQPPPSFGALTSSAYSEILCTGASNPCGTYDGQSAADYAIKWDLNGQIEADAFHNHNRNYGYFGGNGGDCTNFTSQALKAGGMHFMRANGRDDPAASDTADHTDQYLYGEGSWWSYWTAPVAPDPVGPRTYGVTQSWVRAGYLFHHLLDYGLAEIVPHGGRVRAGDIVIYDLNGPSSATADLDHSQIVTSVTPRSIWVVQHSPGYRHTLHYVLHHRIGGTVGVDFQYWILHPLHTRTNLTS